MSTSGFDYDAWDLRSDGNYPEEHWKHLEELWPNGDRLTLAMNLSPTPEVCADLLRGQYVDPARLDPLWLRWAKREQFVALKSALECL